jgi:hypothetical protein
MEPCDARNEIRYSSMTERSWAGGGGGVKSKVVLELAGSRAGGSDKAMPVPSKAQILKFVYFHLL